MTYGAIPKHMQNPGAGKVAVYVSDAVLPYTHQRWRMGWQIAQIGHAQALMRASEFNGQANRGSLVSASPCRPWRGRSGLGWRSGHDVPRTAFEPFLATQAA